MLTEDVLRRICSTHLPCMFSEQIMEYHLQAVDQLTFTDGMEQEENGEGKC